MDKKKIKELKKQKSKLWNDIQNINKQISLIEIEDYNYEGKFIHYEGRGYMYVSWQNKNEAEMFFQGFYFDGEITEYRDMFDLFSSAMEGWWVPIDTFKRDAAEGRIKLLTKEEFITVLNKLIDEYKENFPSMLEKAIKFFENK